jgi:hypothetical protein
MSTWMKVTRFNLVGEPLLYAAYPWFIAALNFLIVWVIFDNIPGTINGMGIRWDPAAPIAFCIAFAIRASLRIKRTFPVALALGLTRRSYYTNTVLLGAGLSVIYGLALAVLQVAELATRGWGIAVYQFWQPWILQGPWYLSWGPWSAMLVLMFVYGIWWGIVYWRWQVPGIMAFTTANVVIVVAGILLIAKANAWQGILHVASALGPAGLTAAPALLALLLCIGGYAVIRRTTV